MVVCMVCIVCVVLAHLAADQEEERERNQTLHTTVVFGITTTRHIHHAIPTTATAAETASEATTTAATSTSSLSPSPTTTATATTNTTTVWTAKDRGCCAVAARLHGLAFQREERELCESRGKRNERTIIRFI